MPINERNVKRYAAADLSALEAICPPSDKGMFGFQPDNMWVGAQFGIPNSSLINRAGFDWVITEVGTSGAKAIQAATALLPPFARFTTGSTQHDNIQIQSGIAKTFGSTTVTAWDPFIAKANYNIHFRTRFQITTTVANAAVALGLSIVDTTVLDSSAITSSSFIGFYKAASTAMKGRLTTGGSTTSDDLVNSGGTTFTPTVSTWYTLDMLIKGRTSVNYWIDGVPTGASSLSNLPANTVTLALTAAISANTAAAATLELQSLVAFQEAY